MRLIQLHIFWNLGEKLKSEGKKLYFYLKTTIQNFMQLCGNQGYEVGRAIIYQDNMSCMALMKRGGPGSERSHHINIRHFWLSEKVSDKEVIIEHLGTERMFANVPTKPVQGMQFTREGYGLTNWE
jgi:hypothetical protein